MLNSQDFSPIDVKSFIEELTLVGQSLVWIMIGTPLVQRSFKVRLSRLDDDKGILFVSDFGEYVLISLTRCAIRASRKSEGKEFVQRYELRLKDSMVIISTTALTT